jgi:hypothetical protein
MIIRREALSAALAATTADDTRYFLNAVQIDAAKHCVVATNGHILLVATDTNPQADTDFPAIPGAEYHGDPASAVLADADIIRAMIAATPKKTSIGILTSVQLGANGSDNTAVLSATDLKAPRVAVLTNEGRNFPNYERVLPKAGRPGVRVCLSVEVLDALVKAAKVVRSGVNSNSHQIATITFDVPTSATDLQDNAVITALGITMKGADVTVTGAAMPCRM